MELLNPIDALFLTAESREHPMHVGSLQIYQRPAERGDDFVRSLYAELMSATPVRPRFRRQQRRILGSFSSVVWAHGEIDLEYHLRRCALPQPGGTAELLDLVEHLHGALLDRHRPLWEGRIIEGMAQDRLALYVKMHHALIDGVSAQRLLQRSLSEDPCATRIRAPWTVSHSEPEPDPDVPESLWQQVRHALPRLAGEVGGVRNAVRALAEGKLALPLSAPSTMFNVPIGGARSIAVGSWPMERIHAVRRATGTTVNDVVLALSAAALREYLMKRNALPDKSLTAMVPVNLRRASDTGLEGNLVAALLCDLGTDIADPAQRLAAISTSMREAKRVFTELPRLQALALSALLMSPVGLTFLPGFQALPRVPFNLVISNVPGPREPAYLQGARLEHNYPLSIPFDGQAMNITVTSTADSFDVGIVGCRRSVPQLPTLVDHLDTALTELEHATC